MRRMLAILGTVATAVLVGCDSNGTTVPTENAVSGTWNLASVNGAPLPYVMQSTPKIELMSDQLVVSANGTFTQASQVRITNGGTITNENRNDAGTYTLVGTAATFIFNGGATGAGTVSGTTLTVAQLGTSRVYQKQ